jgi:beta-lactam-binding protein with PASTA domain/tRNA A-37 threonylcarbamoyl transferase component Bud32
MDTTLSDPLIGRLLDGRYRVEAPIAHGGMATVYTALDTRLDRIVALKVMQPSLARDADFVARFHREAKAAARLSHPNVVAVYDQGEDDGHVFLTMEYVEGRTLRDLLRERGRLTPAQALSILEYVVSALAAAHSAGLVHRDVKPENVLLADDGRVKVADFGLARAAASADHTQTTGVLIGTVAYLAPEQVERGVADARSDVYAVGVMLYEMLVGKPPYDGETAWAVASKHVHEDVPPPSASVPGVPKEVDDLVLAATQRDPARRITDGRQLLELVRSARTSAGPDGADLTIVARADTPASAHTQVLGAPIGTQPPAASAPTKPRRRRLGWIIAAVVVVLALVAAGLGYFFAAGRYVHVPNVTGQTTAAATTKLKHEGFTVHTGAPVFSAVDVGLVAKTSPAADARVHKGADVTIYPSKGIEQYAVPSLKGKTQAQADDALRTLHLVPTFTQDYSTSVKSGYVISTSPPAGRKLRPGSDVLVHVSKGPEPVTIPDETGKPESEAKSVLTGLGLQVVETQAFNDSVPAGNVVSQNPGPGPAHKGDTVNLTISKGPQRVPDVVGMNVNQARRELQSMGFKVDVSKPFGFGNTVRAQNPTAGTPAHNGDTVTLLVY